MLRCSCPRATGFGGRPGAPRAAPAGAVNGDLGTRWSSASSDAQWLRVDMGSSVALRQIVPRREGAYAKDCRIELPTDGANR
ncbi:discoidin domain-containing protein [Streptomyces sp. D54]|uniref:discoidin domain-containing protein n=1 Tax=Streptomyces sp. D54 TaxID=1290289 RepID=UPI003CF4C596